MLTLIDPHTLQPFPSASVGGRQCFAIPHQRAFAVHVQAADTMSDRRRFEAVLSVDGRDVLTNTPASPSASGMVFSSSYTCKGFRVSAAAVREFVHMPSGLGVLTAERAGAPEHLGLVGLALYNERSQGFLAQPAVYRDGGASMRGLGMTRGGDFELTRGGAMAGAEVSAPTGQTHWTRAGAPTLEVVEYDTHEGWAARGVVIPRLSEGSPWPAATSRFADPSTL